MSRIYLILLACLVSGISCPAFADGRNATLGAGLHRIVEVASAASRASCRNQKCSLPAKPLYLRIDIPGQSNAQLFVTKIRYPYGVTQSIDGMTLDRNFTTPTLIQGMVKVRHAGENGRTAWFPASAAVLGNKSKRKIEVTIPRRASRYSARKGSLATITSMIPISESTSHNARASTPSSYALLNKECGTQHLEQLAIQPLQNRKAPLVVRASSTKYLTISTDADAQFYARFGDTTFSNILARLNSAEAIYEAQLNIEFVYNKQNVFTVSNTQPYTSVDSSVLLGQFRSYKESARHLGTSDVYVMFTGKNLDNNVLGVAYLSQGCVSRASSAAVIQAISTSTDLVTIAHEMGHLLSMTHYDAVFGIMNTYLAAERPTAFASFSLDQATSHLAANYSSGCLGNAPPATPTPVVTATPTPTRTSTPVGAPPPGTTPTPTPTSRPNNGQPGGNDPGLDAPVSLGFTAKLTAKGAFTSSITPTLAREGCNVYVFASANSALTGSSEIYASSAETTSTIALAATLKKAAKMEGKKPNGKIYFSARLVCDGEVEERSPLRSVNAASLKSTKVTKKAWIKLLKSGLNSN